MKKVTCYQDEAGNAYAQDSSTAFFIGCTPEPLEEAPGDDNQTLLKLVVSGMSAEDIIKLKHGGVL